MKRITIFAALLLCALAPQLDAVDRSRTEESCSNADLRGTYSFVASGTFGPEAFATAGQTTYDGRGKVRGIIQVSLTGVLTPPLDWSGTYDVDPVTCATTKTANIPGFGAVDFFVTAGDNFRELRFIATTPGATITGTAKKR